VHLTDNQQRPEDEADDRRIAKQIAQNFRSVLKRVRTAHINVAAQPINQRPAELHKIIPVKDHKTRITKITATTTVHSQTPVIPAKPERFRRQNEVTALITQQTLQNNRQYEELHQHRLEIDQEKHGFREGIDGEWEGGGEVDEGATRNVNEVERGGGGGGEGEGEMGGEVGGDQEGEWGGGGEDGTVGEGYWQGQVSY
jgi:hypothetical protein